MKKSLRNTTDAETALSFVPWIQDATDWVSEGERTAASNGREQVGYRAAVDVIDQIRPRLLALLKKSEVTEVKDAATRGDQLKGN